MKTKKPSLESLIKVKHFDWTNSLITEDVFPIEIRKHKGYKLFHFDRYISSEDAVKEMEKEGYSPANIAELLLWKDWNDKDWVVALGSVGKVGGSRRVPGLDEDGSERGLRLYDWVYDWVARYRFLGVRNLSLKTSDTQKSGTESLVPFDTSAIKNQIGIIEEELENLKELIK